MSNLSLVNQQNFKDKLLIDIWNEKFKKQQTVILKNYTLAIIEYIQMFLMQIQKLSQRLQQDPNFSLPQNDLEKLLKNAHRSKYLVNTFNFTIYISENVYQTIENNTYKYQCQICANKFTKASQLISFTKCDHKFCNNCLLNCVNESLKNYEIITCPQDGCSQQINLDSPFYKSLSNESRSKYFKVRQIQLTRQYNYFKICPKQTCNGIMAVLQNQPMICELCKVQFCKQCFIPKHQGTCNQYQIKQMKQKYKYQVCSNCKHVVQKISQKQCQHITCICKYQFCYFCGEKWNTSHYNCQTKRQEKKTIIRRKKDNKKKKITKDKKYYNNKVFKKYNKIQQRNINNQNNQRKNKKIKKSIKQKRIIKQQKVEFHQYLYFILLCHAAFIILISLLVFGLICLLIRGIFFESCQYLLQIYQKNLNSSSRYYFNVLIHITLVIFFPVLFIIGIYKASIQVINFIESGWVWQWLKNQFSEKWVRIS